MTFEPVDYGDDEYETAATRPRPRRPRRGFWRRFWRSLTGQRASAETCRPVTVSGDDGEPVHTTVLGAEPMSNEIRAAFAEIVRAAQRKHREELRAARQAADDDVRAVGSLLAAVNGYMTPRLEDAIVALDARFADRIAELAKRDGREA